MADEFVVGITLQHVPTGALHNKSRATVTQNSTAKAGGIIEDASTSATSFDLTNVTAPGMAYFENLDATDSIEIGISVSVIFEPFAEIKPGLAITLYLHADVKSATALQYRAVAGTPDLLYEIYDQ